MGVIVSAAGEPHFSFIEFTRREERLSGTERSRSCRLFILPEITVGVIDDDIFEEDEYFYVHLSNPRVVGYPEVGTAPLDSSATPKAVLSDNHTATVTIYDDDHAGEPSL